MPLVEVSNLVKHFLVRGGVFNRVLRQVHAVNGVSFAIEKGKILGVVGESGCGKSTLGKLIVRLLDMTAGKVQFRGQDISHLSASELMSVRRKMQMIFQDPHASLNPRMTVGAAVREVVAFHKIVPKREIRDEVDALFAKVGIHTDSQEKYPHEFSGGQKQRVGIARSLAVNPEFIIADEPVSALDVSIQAQVLNLLMDLKDEFDLTMLFISHDLKVIDHFCDSVLVMYLGFVLEELPCRDIQADALHPYTKALLGANPVADPTQRHELTVLAGEVPSPYDLPRGCPFAARCELVTNQCRQEMPPLVEKESGHRVACWEV
ncbi:MAG: ATP-binding cassette domain-containing protein [Pirellulales bacterium]|nr:ATP-binding cassette domain-containing protein [Pirellulales bacterium]